MRQPRVKATVARTEQQRSRAPTEQTPISQTRPRVDGDPVLTGGIPTLPFASGQDRSPAAHSPRPNHSYPKTLSTAAAIRPSFGIAAVSRFFAYGSGTSAIPTRSTGASRSSKHAFEIRAAISAVTP
jgi:hypothetical protein